MVSLLHVYVNMYVFHRMRFPAVHLSFPCSPMKGNFFAYLKCKYAKFLKVEFRNAVGQVRALLEKCFVRNMQVSLRTQY